MSVARRWQYLVAMRLLGLSVLACAACGTNDEGAHLSFAAPADLGPVSRVQIVLASADGAFIEAIDHQRVAPKSFTDETVTYYRQAASGGTFDAVDMSNQFTIRLAPNTTVFPATEYIPFALVYGANSTLIGIGTYHAAGDPTPHSIKIVPGEIDFYTLAIEAVTAPRPDAPIAAGQDVVVDCISQSQTPWRSGFAWRPEAGPELRVLLPDTSDNAGAQEALDRMLDLDCDAHAASDSDCDDTLPRYHRGATELCDGEDTNCDSQQFWVTPCTTTIGVSCPSPTTNMGVGLCDEAKSTVLCQNDPECLCTNNPTGCAKCTLSTLASTTVGNAIPCQPALGRLTIQCSGTCVVDMLAASPGWNVAIAADPSGPYGPKAIITSSHLYVKAKLLAGPSAEIQKDTNVGQFHLSIVNPQIAPRLMSVALQLGDFISTCPMSSGQMTMICQP